MNNNLEKIVKSKGANLLAQAFSARPSKRNDQYEWEINGGTITAIPLNGEKIRGFRANILVLDEFLSNEVCSGNTALCVYVYV